MKKNKKVTFGYCMNYVILFLGIAITLFPLYLMFATSTKSTYQFATNFWGIQVPVQWDNYITAWEEIGGYFFNTLKVAAMQIVGTIIISVLAAYAFAKLRFKGKNFILLFIMMFRMIPATLTLVPSFLNAYHLGLYNTHLGIVLPTLAGSAFMPFLLTKGFFQGLPDSIFESFRIDGAGEFAIMTKLVIPLSKPIILTNALFIFFNSFGSYTWPLLMISDDKLKTVAIGLASFSGAYGTNYGVQMAAYSIVTLILMVIVSLTMKTYVNGITAGAVKG